MAAYKARYCKECGVLLTAENSYFRICKGHEYPESYCKTCKSRRVLDRYNKQKEEKKNSEKKKDLFTL